MNRVLNLEFARRQHRAVRIDLVDGTSIEFCGVKSIDLDSGFVSVVVDRDGVRAPRMLSLADIAVVAVMPSKW